MTGKERDREARDYERARDGGRLTHLQPARIITSKYNTYRTYLPRNNNYIGSDSLRYDRAFTCHPRPLGVEEEEREKSFNRSYLAGED